MSKHKNNTRQPSKCHPYKLHYAKGLCRNCYARQQTAAWKSNNTAKYKSQEYYRKLHQRYGVTTTLFQQLLANQNGACALCKEAGIFKTNTKGTAYFSLVVDHDHTTGQVRGLLCQHCNIALGGYEAVCDNPELAAYLKLGRVK